jgi:tetratricopeptide (TPR) repeat protein
MVLNIADANQWKKPLYFACTVSPDNFMGLDPYLQMQGMVYRVMPHPLAQNERVDIERIATFLEKTCKLRPFPQRLTDVDEPYEGIYNDYVICYMWLAMQLQERMTSTGNEIKELQKKPSGQDTSVIAAKHVQFNSDFNRAISGLDRIIGFMPWNMQPVALRQQILMKLDKAAMAEERARKLIAQFPDNAQLRSMLVQALEAQGKRKEAQEILQKG